MGGELVSYLAIGGVAGLLAGLLGVGGGLIIVPALIWLFRGQGMDSALVVHLAVGSSLASILFTSISSVLAHHRRGAVLWPVVARLVPGILLGTATGALLAKGLDAVWLQRVFAGFAVAMGVRMLLAVRMAGTRELPESGGMLVVGGVIGGVSALVGIGGGSMTVPFLAHCRVDMRRAVATSSACGFPIALFGTAGFLIAGWGIPTLPAGSSGFVYWPAVAGIALVSMLTAPPGAALAHRLPLPALRQVFGVLLLVLGVRMFF